VSATVAEPAAPARATSQTSFLWRKLHSLTGVAPIGGYLLFHMYENLKVIFGPRAYDEVIENVAHVAPLPWFYLLEFGLILIPIAYHSAYGFYVWWQGQPNALAYPYRRAWLYWAQRVSGILAFLYIAYHYWILRWPTFVHSLGEWLQFTTDYVPATYAIVREHLSNPAVWAFYALGNLAAAFHFGNGLYGFAFSWGLAIGRKAQMAWELLGWAVTITLSAASLHILYVFVR
jgi:succinate dehydrogenase/fumarate reductase cytochrome b subunit (b558 family)